MDGAGMRNMNHVLQKTPARRSWIREYTPDDEDHFARKLQMSLEGIFPPLQNYRLRYARTRRSELLDNSAAAETQYHESQDQMTDDRGRNSQQYFNGMSSLVQMNTHSDIRTHSPAYAHDLGWMPTAKRGAMPNTIEIFSNLDIYACPSMHHSEFRHVKQYYTHVLNMPYSDKYNYTSQPEGSQRTARIVLPEPWEIFPCLDQIISEIIAGVAPGCRIFVYAHGGQGYTNKFGSQIPPTVNRSAVAVIAYLCGMFNVCATRASNALNRGFSECGFPHPAPHPGHLAQIDAQNEISGYEDNPKWQDYRQRVKSRTYQQRRATFGTQSRAQTGPARQTVDSSPNSFFSAPGPSNTSPPTSPEALHPAEPDPAPSTDTKAMVTGQSYSEAVRKAQRYQDSTAVYHSQSVEEDSLTVRAFPRSGLSHPRSAADTPFVTGSGGDSDLDESG